MKPVYETSSENGSAQVQNVAILCNFVRPQKVQVRSSKTMSSYQCILRFFHPMSLKYCACHEKVIRSTAPVTQNLLSKPEDLMLQNVTHLRTSAPWPPATRNVFFFACPLQICTPHRLWNCCKAHAFGWPFTRCRIHCACHTKQRLNVHFDFIHFYVEMSLAQQRRALFHRLNFQKCSGPEVFCTFLLGNVLSATTPYTFWTSQPPKVFRRR